MSLVVGRWSSGMTVLIKLQDVTESRNMMKSPSKIYLLMMALVASFLLASCGIVGGGTTTVKIGLLSPQTGPIAVYAPGFEDAANVADQV